MLIAVGRRHAFAELLTRLLRSAAAALAATALVRTALHLYGVPLTWWHLAFLFALVTAAAAKLWAKGPLSRLQIARLIDDRLELKDRLATAVEFHGQTSHVLFWLFKDADQQARFVDPRRVVPLAPTFNRRDALLGALLALGLILWIAPIPAGILAHDAQSGPGPSDPAYDGEAGIEARIEALRARLQALQSPQVDLLLRDLEALQTGLRERTLPQDEAVALLEHLERRFVSPEERQSFRAEPVTGSQAGLDRIQDLASRITAAAESLERPGDASPQSVVRLVREMLDDNDLGPASEPLRRALDQLEQGDPEGAARSLREAASMMEDVRRQWLRQEQANAGSGSGPQEEASIEESGPGFAPDPDETGQGAPGQEEQAGAMAVETTSEQAAAGQGGASPAEGATSAPGATSGAPSTSPGLDGSDPYLPSGSFRTLFDVRGETGTGPLRSGTVQTSLTGLEGGGSPSESALPGFAARLDEATSSVEREAIPQAYRDVIRQYFRILEPAFDGG